MGVILGVILRPCFAIGRRPCYTAAVRFAMLRRTALYAAGLSVWTSAAVAASEIVRLLAYWSYKDGRSYTGFLFNDVTAFFYAFVASASFAIGAVAFLCTWRGGRSRARMLLLTVLVPGLLVLSAAALVTLLYLLQARENGALVHPMALLSVFPTALRIAAVDLAVPGIVASAAWSWFFCRR
ncbi:MAG: hypothetical protein JSS04_20395 [Proteobacteria bacterium]|nr:hypothetical protein [Pseudomonadota bacterium]